MKPVDSTLLFSHFGCGLHPVGLSFNPAHLPSARPVSHFARNLSQYPPAKPYAARVPGSTNVYKRITNCIDPPDLWKTSPASRLYPSCIQTDEPPLFGLLQPVLIARLSGGRCSPHACSEGPRAPRPRRAARATRRQLSTAGLAGKRGALPHVAHAVAWQTTGRCGQVGANGGQRVGSPAGLSICCPRFVPTVARQRHVHRRDELRGWTLAQALRVQAEFPSLTALLPKKLICHLCSTRAVRLQSTRSASAVSMQCICSANAVHVHCSCVGSASRSPRRYQQGSNRTSGPTFPKPSYRRTPRAAPERANEGPCSRASGVQGP